MSEVVVREWEWRKADHYHEVHPVGGAADGLDLDRDEMVDEHNAVVAALRAALAEVADHEAMLLGEMRRCEKAEADAARWKAALERYGQHFYSCPEHEDWGDSHGQGCTCGLSAALTAPAQEGEKI